MAQKKLTEEQKKIRKAVLDQLEQAIMSLPADALPEDDDQALKVDLGLSKVDKEDVKEEVEEEDEEDDEDFQALLKKMKKKQNKSNY